MQKRGPKSAADLAVVPGGFGQKPPPPDELTDEEKAIWRAIAASEPVEFLNTGTTQAMLKDLCRHRAAAEKITRVINLFQDEWLRAADGAKRYAALLRARDGEVRAATYAATKLRLTNQSRYDALKANTAGKNTSKGYRPWDVEG